MNLNTSTTDVSWFQQSRRAQLWLFLTAMLACMACTAIPALSQEAPAAQVQPAAPVESTAPAESSPGDSGQQNSATPSTRWEAVQAGGAAPPSSGGTETQSQTSPAQPAPQPESPQTQPSSQPPVDAAAPAQPPSAQGAISQAPTSGTSNEPAGAAAPADAPASPQAIAPAVKPGASGARQAPGQPREHLPHDLSPWNMFLAADIIVKGVMILLAVASVLAWSIWFGKSVQVSFSTRRLRRGMDELDGDASLAIAAERRRSSASPLAVMIAAANDEVMRSQGGLMPAAGIKERVASHLSRIESSAGRAMTSGTGLLATIGSTAPFVGLFGTVWGIMNSFISISQAQTTNLAVVAPGIAEALLATGIGLVAAIPAVIFYNQLARSISGYKARLADCGAMVERLVSRDLDRQSVRTPYLKAGE